MCRAGHIPVYISFGIWVLTKKFANWQRVSWRKQHQVSFVRCPRALFVVIRGAENMMERIIGTCANHFLSLNNDGFYNSPSSALRSYHVLCTLCPLVLSKWCHKVETTWLALLSSSKYIIKTFRIDKQKIVSKWYFVKVHITFNLIISAFGRSFVSNQFRTTKRFYMEIALKVLYYWTYFSSSAF